ncbi:MAG: hypothetical protein ABSE69_09010 [Roseiarcus sp.]|jgi:hypothetical protein
MALRNGIGSIVAIFGFALAGKRPWAATIYCGKYEIVLGYFSLVEIRGTMAAREAAKSKKSRIQIFSRATH